MKKLITISLIYIFSCLLNTSCKEKCGCEIQPLARITTAEVTLRYDPGRPLILYNLIFHEICNKEIISKELLDSIKKNPYSGIKVIIDGDSIQECKEGKDIAGPFIRIISKEKAN